MGSIIKAPPILESHALESPFVRSSPVVHPKVAPVSQLHTLTEEHKAEANSKKHEELVSDELVVELEQKNTEHLAELEEQARSDGFKQGYAEGKAAAQDEFSEFLSILGAMTQSGKLALQQQLDSNHALIASIVFEAVCKIIGERLITVEGCKEQVSHLIRGVQEEDLIAVKVSSRDLARIEKSGLAGSPPFADIKLEADPSVALGGCIIKLRDGIIDGRIETQLSILTDTLKEVVSSDDSQ